MRSSLLLASACAALLLLLCLSSLLSSASAQPPPRVSLPDDFFHGWVVDDFDFHPSAPVVYVIDDGWQVVAVNTTTGRPLALATPYYTPPHTEAQHIAVDSKGQVYVTLTSYVVSSWWEWLPTGVQLLVFDSFLRPLRNTSVSTVLRPPSNATQIAIDSDDYIFLFSERLVPINPTVWVLEPRALTQVDAWKANLPVVERGAANYTDYLLAIDSTDVLYFQQTTAQRRTYLFSSGSDYVATLDLLGYSSNYRTPVTDLTIDAALNLYFVSADSMAVEVFDTNGKRLPSLRVLSGPSLYAEVPRLDVDAQGVVQVSDPVQQVIVSASSDGYILRSLGSYTASSRFASELFIDANTGDIVVGFPYNSQDLVAYRLSPRDGALLQTYAVPSRLRDICDSVAFDVGGQRGHLYVLLSCYAEGLFGYRLHVMQPSGRVQSEFVVPFGGYRMRVDEYNQRIYIADVEARSRVGVVRVLDMQGRHLSTLGTSNPSLSYLSDLLIEPGPDGGDLVLLDPDNSRVVHLAPNGSVAFVVPLDPRTEVWDIAYADRGEVYASATVYDDAWQALNSSIIHFDRRGAVMELFVGWGSQLNEPLFGAIAVADNELYALDENHDAVVVWRNRRRPEGEAVGVRGEGEGEVRRAEAEGGSGEGERGEEDVVALKLRARLALLGSEAPAAASGRHALMRGRRFQRR